MLKAVQIIELLENKEEIVKGTYFRESPLFRGSQWKQKKLEIGEVSEIMRDYFKNTIDASKMDSTLKKIDSFLEETKNPTLEDFKKVWLNKLWIHVGLNPDRVIYLEDSDFFLFIMTE